jgi:hypothetical protein
MQRSDLWVFFFFSTGIPQIDKPVDASGRRRRRRRRMYYCGGP